MPADFPGGTGRLLGVSCADDDDSPRTSTTMFQTPKYKELTNALSG